MKDKYDISVADHHNYMVGGINNGVIVHNSPETTAGGNALKFYASMRLDIRRIGAIKDKEVNIGNHVRIKTVKNKIFPPFKEAEVDFLYEKGFNLVGEILDMAVDKGFVVKGGAWYSYNDAKLGQGRDNSCGFLTDNPAIFEEIKAKVLAK